MRKSRSLIMILALAISLLYCAVGVGQQRSRVTNKNQNTANRKQPSARKSTQKQTSANKSTQKQSPANKSTQDVPTQSTDRQQQSQPIGSRKLDPKSFMHPCYKIDALIERDAGPLKFMASESQWNQPNGPGTTITLTYSYSNLMDGKIKGLTPAQLRQATEEALTLWASVAPINFVEIKDVGPLPTASESTYTAGKSAQIRIGAHSIDGGSGNELAHAYLPFSNTDGIAGDLHFDVDEDWSGANGSFFLETALHELGHCLGLGHEEVADAIMNPFIMNRFSELGDGFLLADDIAGIQKVYGSGTGTVTPLDEVPIDEPVDPAEANDVVAELDVESGLITLQGNALDNSLLVYSSRWFTAVWGYNNTTINGKQGVYWSNLDNASFQITASDGNDLIYLFGVATSSAKVDLGAGDDSLAVILSRIETLTDEGGQGEDGLLKFFSRITKFVETGFEKIW